jgi:hypothetical protein
VEAVGFLGGALTLAGVMTFLAQLRRQVPKFRSGTALLVLGLAMVGAAYYVTTNAAPVAANHPVSPATTAPTQASPTTLPVPTTVAEFAALSHDQQKAVMQQEVDRFNSVLDRAYRNLDLSLLPEVTTGPELQTQQRLLAALKANGTPGGGDHNYMITGIGTAPALGSVSVRIEGTDRSWYLDPKTLQPVGQPHVDNSPATYTLVPQDGVWKVELVVVG